MKDKKKELKQLKAQYEALEKEIKPLEEEEENIRNKKHKLSEKQSNIQYKIRSLDYRLNKETLAKKMKPGDYVQTDTGEYGTVELSKVEHVDIEKEKIFCTVPYPISCLDKKVTKQEHDKYWNLG
jgi:chromosome segregation ATPase